MDIISRLKTFLNNKNISNSQFADTCGIPRPTLSQLLNGRNKKISDEIISKIHDTYPSLSILWLLFGEGQMETDENIEFSEGLNDQNYDKSTSYIPENKSNNESELQKKNVRNFDSNRKFEPLSAVFGSNELTDLDEMSLSDLATDKDDFEGGKRITNIVVFYSDNSFQSFKPMKD